MCCRRAIWKLSQTRGSRIDLKVQQLKQVDPIVGCVKAPISREATEDIRISGSRTGGSIRVINVKSTVKSVPATRGKKQELCTGMIDNRELRRGSNGG